MAKRRDAESKGERRYRKILSDIKAIEPKINVGKRSTAHKEGINRLTGRRGVRARARNARIWERRHNGTYKYSRAKEAEIAQRVRERIERERTEQPVGGTGTNSP